MPDHPAPMPASMQPDPVSLRLFLAVIEERTIAAAAQREHIAAAAVSKRLSELEAALGTRLLSRTNKGVAPTAAGLALAGMARRALRELGDIPAAMREYGQGVRGVVRVCANISVLTQFLPRDIASFRELHPGVHFELEERITPAVIQAVYDNEADIGLCSGMVPDHDVVVLPYRTDRLACVVPRGHPLALAGGFAFEAALEYPVIGLHPGSALNRIVAEAAARLGRRVDMAVHVTGFDALCFMVEAGLGIGLLPTELAQRYARIFELDVLDIDEPWAERQLQICVRSIDGLPAAARRFLDHLGGVEEGPPS